MHRGTIKLKRFSYTDDGSAKLTLNFGSFSIVVTADVDVSVDGDALSYVSEDELQELIETYREEFTRIIDVVFASEALRAIVEPPSLHHAASNRQKLGDSHYVAE